MFTFVTSAPKAVSNRGGVHEGFVKGQIIIVILEEIVAFI